MAMPTVNSMPMHAFGATVCLKFSLDIFIARCLQQFRKLRKVKTVAAFNQYIVAFRLIGL